MNEETRNRHPPLVREWITGNRQTCSKYAAVQREKRSLSRRRTTLWLIARFTDWPCFSVAPISVVTRETLAASALDPAGRATGDEKAADEGEQQQAELSPRDG